MPESTAREGTAVGAVAAADRRRPSRLADLLRLDFSITILVATVATPIWGRLADVSSAKLLFQLAILTFVCWSCLAGLSTSTSLLIAFRVAQGVGVGGVFTLCTIVLSDIRTPGAGLLHHSAVER
jgi:MFS family permease